MEEEEEEEEEENTHANVTVETKREWVKDGAVHAVSNEEGARSDDWKNKVPAGM